MIESVRGTIIFMLLLVMIKLKILSFNMMSGLTPYSMQIPAMINPFQNINPSQNSTTKHLQLPAKGEEKKIQQTFELKY